MCYLHMTLIEQREPIDLFPPVHQLKKLITCFHLAGVLDDYINIIWSFIP